MQLPRGMVSALRAFRTFLYVSSFSVLALICFRLIRTLDLLWFGDLCFFQSSEGNYVDCFLACTGQCRISEAEFRPRSTCWCCSPAFLFGRSLNWSLGTMLSILRARRKVTRSNSRGRTNLTQQAIKLSREQIRLNKLLSTQCQEFLECQSSMHISTSRTRENEGPIGVKILEPPFNKFQSKPTART